MSAVDEKNADSCGRGTAELLSPGMVPPKHM